MNKTINIHTAAEDLAALWPALAGALERDNRPNETERVSGSTAAGVPVNDDVLRVITTLTIDIPRVSREAAELLGEPERTRPGILDHLAHLPRMHDRMLATNATGDAHFLAGVVGSWLRQTKTALGLRNPDRRLGQFCPLHDDNLSELVAPGDEADLVHDRDGYRVIWSHADAVLCRSCGASWTPSQYLLLGRMLREADHRRVALSAGECAA